MRDLQDTAVGLVRRLQIMSREHNHQETRALTIISVGKFYEFGAAAGKLASLSVFA
jgi:hypothetical protein